MTSPSSSNTTRAAMKSCSSMPALTPLMPSWRSRTRSKALLCLTNTSSESSFPRIGCSKRVSLNVHSCIYETRYKWWISVSFLPFFLSLSPRFGTNTRDGSSVCALLVAIERCVVNKTRHTMAAAESTQMVLFITDNSIYLLHTILKNNLQQSALNLAIFL